MRCLIFYIKVDIYMLPLVLRRGRNFLCRFLNALKNIWLKTIIFLPLDKWGLKSLPRKKFYCGG